jgi:hypothetical protein
MEAKLRIKRALIVGLGGIGSNLIGLVSPALQRIDAGCHITLMDGDTIEAGNLGHQQFKTSEIGHSKAMVLAQRHTPLGNDKLKITGLDENLRKKDQLVDYDFVIVCVDRPHPRRLVHLLDAPWIDLRCTGDGWMAMSSETNRELVHMMTPDHEPKSCQIEGALDSGNLEFGYAVAAAVGAQWLVQKLRQSRSPIQSMGSLTHGMFEFPEVTSNRLEASV